jgi:hypothetical protein
MTMPRYPRGAERPSMRLWLLNDDGQPEDLTGYALTLKLGQRNAGPALLTKSSGLIGQAGSGVEPTGVPNFVANWTAGELDLPPGTYALDVTATAGGLDRKWQLELAIGPVVA